MRFQLNSRLHRDRDTTHQAGGITQFRSRKSNIVDRKHAYMRAGRLFDGVKQNVAHVGHATTKDNEFRMQGRNNVGDADAEIKAEAMQLLRLLGAAWAFAERQLGLWANRVLRRAWQGARFAAERHAADSMVAAGGR